MNKNIEFQKTGNFWMDNGIVGLFRILEKLKEDNKINDVDVKLTTNALILSVNTEWVDNDQAQLDLFGEKATPEKEDTPESILEALNQAKDFVTSNYLGFTKNYGWIYQNNEFKEYQKTDFKMYLKPFFVGKTGVPEGSLNMPNGEDLVEILEKANLKTKIKIEIEKKIEKYTIELLDFELQSFESKKEKFVKKPNLVLTTKKGDKEEKGESERNRNMSLEELKDFLTFMSKNHKKVLPDGKTKFDVAAKGYLNNPPKYNIGSNFEDNFLKVGKRVCAFSGEKLAAIDSVTGMDYPFLTGKRGEMNFASHLNIKPMISAKYSFIALFSFYNLHYSLQDDLKNYFVIYDSNLRELNNFYHGIESSIDQIRNVDYANFKNELIGTQHEQETLFAFVISIFKQAQARLEKDLRKDVLTKSIFTFTNDGNIFRDVKEYTSLESMFDLLSSFQEAGVLTNFLTLVQSLQKKLKENKYDTTYRNRFSSAILNFQSIHSVIELFLGEVRIKEEKPFPIGKLEDIISIYNKKISDMDNKMVDLCKSVGNRIGRYCRETDDKGILFSIRNVRNRIDFLKVLSESQFRTEVLYSEEFFDRLPDTPQWEEYKSLVSIFAMNSYLSKFITENPATTPTIVAANS
jgi:hypothetical protein